MIMWPAMSRSWRPRVRGYIALHGPSPGQGGHDRLAGQIAASSGWDISHEIAGWRILTPPGGGLPVRRLPGDMGLVVGDLIHRGATAPLALDALQSLPNLSSLEIARVLMRGYWGRYVALIHDAQTGRPAVFRDPAGALDCVTWRIEDVDIVTSHPAAALPAAAPRELGLDWERIAELVADPGACGGALPLTGLRTICAGALRLGDQETQLWTPAQFAARPVDNVEEAKIGLRRAVDSCVAAYVAPDLPLLAEISGGLDSAIVASTIRQSPGANVASWLNYHDPDPWGDERTYARAVADRLRVPLTEARLPDTPFDPSAFGPTVESHRPSLCGLDAAFDIDLAARCAVSGAQRMLTGQGGDALFFQRPTATIAVDAMREHGLAAFATPLPVAVARWMQVSVWSVMGQMWRSRRPAANLHNPTARDCIRTGLPDPRHRHPWLTGCGGLPPAKQLQIADLTACAMHYGDCRRARAVDLVHPLLSQPILEHCLAIPATMLTAGWRDRALARATFADRLPAAITDRRSKGGGSRLFGHRLTAGLAAIRQHLLEGRLAERGLIDRELLDAKLTPERLIWEGDYGTIVYVAFLESWVRHWEGRIAEFRATAGSGPAS